MRRRDFLRTSVLAAIPAIGVAGGIPRALAAVMAGNTPAIQMMAGAAYAPPVRSRGGTTVNVRDWGAAGNGTRDDTTSFQAAIDALPSTGGTVFVPAGN